MSFSIKDMMVGFVREYKSYMLVAMILSAIYWVFIATLVQIYLGW